MKVFHTGDMVTWHSSGTTGTGQIKRVITQDTVINNSTIHASDEEPQYLVRNSHSGNFAIHTSASLEKHS